MTSFMESRTSPRPHRRRWPARPDLGEWGHSRLVATAAGDLSCSSKVLRRPHTSPLRYCVFGSLYRPSPDDLPSRLRLEYCWLLCERIDAAPLLCGGLLDDNEFGESGHKEGSRFLELFVAYLGKRLDDALDVLPRHIVRMLLSDSLNELRLRHQLGHVSLPISESSCD